MGRRMKATILRAAAAILTGVVLSVVLFAVLRGQPPEGPASWLKQAAPIFCLVAMLSSIAYACYALIKIARCPACDGRVWFQAASHMYLAPHQAVSRIDIPSVCPHCGEEIFPEHILK